LADGSSHTLYFDITRFVGSFSSGATPSPTPQNKVERAIEAFVPAGLTPAGWRMLRPKLNGEEVALIRARHMRVLPPGLLALRLPGGGISSISDPSEFAGMVPTPRMRLNHCAFQAYRLYSFVCRGDIHTRAGRRMEVLAELKRCLAWCAARAAHGSDDGADESAPTAESVMNRLGSELGRRTGPELEQALAGVVLGDDDTIMGTLLRTRATASETAFLGRRLLAHMDANAELQRLLDAVLSRSFVVDSTDLAYEDYVMQRDDA